MSTFPPHMNHVMKLKRLISEVAGIHNSLKLMGESGDRIHAKVPEAVGTDHVLAQAVADLIAHGTAKMSEARDMYSSAEDNLRILLDRIGDGGTGQP